MKFNVILSAVVGLYFLASILHGLASASRAQSIKWWGFVCGFLAICLHGLLLHEWIDITAGQNLNFLNLLSLTLWLVAILVFVMAVIKPLDILLVIVYPAAGFSVLLVMSFPGRHIINTSANIDTLFHILISVIAFCVLLLAGLIAALLAMQEWLLRHKRMGVLLQKLPPLESLETLLFQVVVLGFILLSVVLATSAYFYHQILFHHILLVQKTLLVLAAWIVFAVLIIGRYRRGWRGRRAIYYTLFGVLLLLLAYIGSNLVLEAIH